MIDVLPKTNAPCLDCPERHAGCHGKCEKYIQFRKERDEENRRRWQESQKTYNPRIELLNQARDKYNRRHNKH